MSPRADAIAQHVEAAKRLLDDLEQHAAAALQALGDERGEDFVAAVEERDRILGELNQVVDALAQERLDGGASDGDANDLISEMAQVAALAFASQQQLLERTRQERDRLAAALTRSQRPDTVANQYAAATLAPRTATISVTG
jgi:hypothetical protein